MAHVQSLIRRETVHGRSPGGTIERLHQLCSALARTLPALGVAVSLMSRGRHGGVIAASDPAAEQLEELQFALGEGPCLDAFAARRPVLEPDLSDPRSSRWPSYTPAAHSRGAAAVFALPLQIGAACLGVLDVYRDRSGLLSRQAMSDALIFAEAGVVILLDAQAGADDHAAGPGLDEALDRRAEVYQAQGMLTVQLGVSLPAAMARLRAYAWAYDRPLAEVARDVVSRRLRLDSDSV